MKEVNVYIRGTCKNTLVDKDGKYMAKLEYNGKCKIIYGHSINTTSNRMLIIAALKAIESLKEPCIINLNTPAPIGLRSKKSPNRGLIDKLKDEVETGGHVLSEIVSNSGQEELIVKMRCIKECYLKNK